MTVNLLIERFEMSVYYYYYYYYQLQLGRQRQVWLIPLVDEMQNLQVKLFYPLTMRAIPEHLRDASCGGTLQIDYFYLPNK